MDSRAPDTAAYTYPDGDAYPGAAHSQSDTDTHSFADARAQLQPDIRCLRAR